MTDPLFPPPFATDCHTHLVGDPARYPMISPRSYTPGLITPGDMRTMMNRVGVARIVVVQISVFGTDNTCMIDGMKALGDCARGVAQVAEDVEAETLDAMHRAGVRGIRVNLNTMGVRDPNEARRRLNTASRICARHGWHLQVFTGPDVVEALGPALLELPVPIVLDHFGLLPVTERGGSAERIVLDLLSSGNGWVKVSGTYRLDHPQARDHIAAIARDLYAANPENIVWGSDWPHPPAHRSAPEPDPPPLPYRGIDPADMLATIRDWFDTQQDREAILVHNPARLYDFPMPDLR